MIAIRTENGLKVNPNEDIRRQFIEVSNQFEEDDDDERLYDELYDIMEALKETNPTQYDLTVRFIYKEIYSYYNYLNKQNETNKDFKRRFGLFQNNPKDIVTIYEDNIDLFFLEFVYILRMNNLFRIKLLLELSSKQNEYLNQVYIYHLYDQLALKNYISYELIEDYYLQNLEEETIIEELTNDILHFMDYLYTNHKKVYHQLIEAILNKIYKWCYYYCNYSIEIEPEDLEMRVINLMNGHSIEQIGQSLHQNKNLLEEILLRIYDDNNLGYPEIETKDGIIAVTEERLNDYIMKVKRKQF